MPSFYRILPSGLDHPLVGNICRTGHSTGVKSVNLRHTLLLRVPYTTNNNGKKDLESKPSANIANQTAVVRSRDNTAEAGMIEWNSTSPDNTPPPAVGNKQL